jgi:hypothetical protein
MHTTIFHNGSVIRFKSGATGIVMLLEERTIVRTQGVLRAIQASELRENPAICPTCLSSAWFWDVDLVPTCRVCLPPSQAWESAMLGRALMSLNVLEGEERDRGRQRIEQAYAAWDIDLLARIVSMQILCEHLKKRKAAP